MTQKIVIVDYGMGNLHSVKKAVEHVSDKSTQIIVSNLAKDIEHADRVILPGQSQAVCNTYKKAVYTKP